MIDPLLYQKMADALVADGYLILPEFLPYAMTVQLYDYVHSLSNKAFTVAGIGRETDLQINEQIRTDKTRWLSEEHPIEEVYLAIMEECRIELNRQLFIGLRDFEAHFAHYEIGDFYLRHFDAFKGSSNRLISVVLYLNPDWSAQDGGELVLYHADSDQVLYKVKPELGTLVLFLSERFPHEVLPAKRDRYSVTGWFRTDNVLLE